MFLQEFFNLVPISQFYEVCQDFPSLETLYVKCKDIYIKNKSHCKVHIPKDLKSIYEGKK